MQVNFDKIQLEIDKFNPEETSGYFTLVEQEQISLPVPRNYSDSYDKAIEMLKRERRQEIMLASEEFNKLILDEWEFSESTKMVNSMYLR